MGNLKDGHQTVEGSTGKVPDLPPLEIHDPDLKEAIRNCTILDFDKLGSATGKLHANEFAYYQYLAVTLMSQDPEGKWLGIRETMREVRTNVWRLNSTKLRSVAGRILRVIAGQFSLSA